MPSPGRNKPKILLSERPSAAQRASHLAPRYSATTRWMGRKRRSASAWNNRVLSASSAASANGSIATSKQVHRTLGGQCIWAGEYARPVAEDLRRTDRACAEQELVVGSLDMRRVVMSRVFLCQHDGAGALEKLGTGTGKRPLLLGDFSEKLQRKGILVDPVQATAREVLKDLVRVESRELVREKGLCVATVKRLKVEQHRDRSIVVFYLDTIGGAPPVRFSARENEGRVARLAELRENRVHTAPGESRGDLVKTVDNDAVSIVNQPLGTRSAEERSRTKPLHVWKKTERLGQDGLSEPGISEDNDGLPERRDLVIAEDLQILFGTFESERSPDWRRHQAKGS